MTPGRCRTRPTPLLPALALASLLAGPAGCTCRGSGTETPPPASGMEAFYDLDVLPDFSITLDDEAIRKLKKEPRDFVRGTFTYQDQVYEDVGVRLKGHRSMRSIDDKPSFKIRFDKYVDGQSFRGQRDLILNNLIEDPTMLREVLGYRLYHEMGVPAPYIGYAQVSVNGAPYGLYALVEAIDERFLSSHFRDGTGDLYEGEYGCDLYEEDVDGFDRDSGTDDTRAALRAFARATSGPDPHLFDPERGPLDLDAFLSYLAVSAFIGDFDGYRHSHNYRIYHQPSLDKWFFVPWGLDRVFKKHLDIYDSNGLLAKRCFADAACRLGYARTMRKVITHFESLQLDQGVAVLATFIDQAARADTRKPYDAGKTAKARAELLEYLAERPERIRAQLGCLDEIGAERDQDGDGYGCLDCNDADPAIHPGAAETCDQIDNDCSGLTDDGAACPCPSVDIEGTTFYLCNLPMPWQEAATFCAGQGHELARIDSAEQSKLLQAAAGKRNDDRWWIGLSDREEDGTFRWRDGTPTQLTNWAKGEPDSDGCSQDCVALKEDGDGKWHDTHCGQHRPFVCR